jgi:hypothetical protein|mmetsp:Transcript_152/g.308  ORF Transcript_152/g.308 Transcript_152/m.308 type:complete len:139 (+) Transcript_152:42-458(+)|eukprot:CAMPEP_0202487498 /NCGR_PEP_ID=MMETSP1361-20130828/5784_1 /ASSEMBLY_ACC=CAM_ASM_000849 /TAXON_ID=210615 /ORGANISM="Staurosira complex sp., Strain CCMP2646" /LENGTH=138 /DNA_ID=CAMNT_0049116871 /DNA_START=852 /DNA_END=1268 /DNA_ORIENTATION=+
MNASANNNFILTNVNDRVNPIEWDFDEFAAVFDLGTSRWCWWTSGASRSYLTLHIRYKYMSIRRVAYFYNGIGTTRVHVVTTASSSMMLEGLASPKSAWIVSTTLVGVSTGEDEIGEESVGEGVAGAAVGILEYYVKL